jgi:hypothetical protein
MQNATGDAHLAPRSATTRCSSLCCHRLNSIEKDDVGRRRILPSAETADTSAMQAVTSSKNVTARGKMRWRGLCGMSRRQGVHAVHHNGKSGNSSWVEAGVVRMGSDDSSESSV